MAPPNNREKKYGVRLPQQPSNSISGTRCHTTRSYGTSGVLVGSRVPAVGHAVGEGEPGRLALTQLAPGRDPPLFWRALVGTGVLGVFVLAALTAYSARPGETWQLRRGTSPTSTTSFRVSSLSCVLLCSVALAPFVFASQRGVAARLFAMCPRLCCVSPATRSPPPPCCVLPVQ